MEQLGKDNTSLQMRNLIAHPRGSHWDMNQIKFIKVSDVGYS